MKIKLLFINLFIFIALSLHGQFDNYEYFPIFLPKSDMEYLRKGKILNDSIYFTEKRIKDIIVTEIDSMPQSIVNIFIERPFMKGNFYYLGYIPINANFETYIFMIDHDWEWRLIFRDFYMINIQENRLLSIFNISYYMGGWSSSNHLFTKFQPTHSILISERTMEIHDIDYMNEEDKPTKSRGDIDTYKITEQGYIEFYK